MVGNGRGLLADRRFLPYFLTQSIAAFNDNLFKNAVILLIVFAALLLLQAAGHVARDVAQLLDPRPEPGASPLNSAQAQP